MNQTTLMSFERVTKLALLLARLSLGIVLLFCTTLVAGIIGQLSFSHHLSFGMRLATVLLSLFFALQSYAVCRIFIFRRRVRRAGSNFSPPGASPEWPLGVPVPVRPSGPWLVRSAAQVIPHEE